MHIYTHMHTHCHTHIHIHGVQAIWVFLKADTKNDAFIKSKFVLMFNILPIFMPVSLRFSFLLMWKKPLKWLLEHHRTPKHFVQFLVNFCCLCPVPCSGDVWALHSPGDPHLRHPQLQQAPLPSWGDPPLLLPGWPHAAGGACSPLCPWTPDPVE